MRLPAALLATIACACSSAQPAAPPERAEAVPRPASTPDAGAGSVDSGIADAGASGPIAFEEYRAGFLRELMRLTKTREEGSQQTEQASIEVLKKIGQAESFVVATAGFGRVGQGRRRAHVELLAYVDQYGVRIGEVLTALGEAMIARGESAEPWKEYDAVELAAPKHGLQYFDLRAAGEVDISPEMRVTLLKVMPMSREEFEKSKNNPSGEWDDPNAATRALQRWRRVLERK